MLAGTVAAEPETFVEFEADFPDPEWEQAGEDDDVVAGRPVAEWLRARLAPAGFPCTAIENHESFAWVFDAAAGNASIECLVQGGERWLLIVESHRPLWDRIRRRPDEGLTEVLRAIREALASDPRVSAVRWSTPAAYRAR